jgi:hypothetical protein
LVKASGTLAFTAVSTPNGFLVGTTATQTLTNKTLSGANNTFSNIPTSSITGFHSVSQGGTGATTLTGLIKGNGTAAFSAISTPNGFLVGTTAAQTLTNKTLSGANNTLSNISVSSLSQGTAATNDSLHFNGTNWAPVSANYVFAYDTSTSQLIASGTASQNVTFSNTTNMTGWTYASGVFTCHQAGIYLISYTGHGQSNATTTTISLTIALNGAEVAGSQSNLLTPVATKPIPISGSVVVSITSGQTISLKLWQSATNANNGLFKGGQGSTPVTARITIVRIN